MQSAEHGEPGGATPRHQLAKLSDRSRALDRDQPVVKILHNQILVVGLSRVPQETACARQGFVKRLKPQHREALSEAGIPLLVR